MATARAPGPTALESTVSRLAHAAAAGVAAARGSGGSGAATDAALPDLLGPMADLRDHFVLDALRAAAAPVGTRGARVDDCSWPAVRAWIVRHLRPNGAPGGRRPVEPAAGTPRATGPSGTPASSPAWLDEPVAYRAYVLVWMVKRFVGGAGASPAARLWVLRTGSASAAAACADADDDVRRVSDVRLVLASRELDVRVWQLVTAIAGDWGRLDASAVTAAAATDAPVGGATPPDDAVAPPASSRPSALARLYDAGRTAGRHVLGKRRRPPAAATAVAAAHGGTPWEAAHVLRVLDAAPGAAGAASVATLTPFELVLALSRYRQLLAAAVGAGGHQAGWVGASGTAAQVAALAPQLRAAVHAVVAGWDAVARASGFADAEAMLAPYLLWSPEQCAYVALSRPGDARFLAPAVQRRVLYHGAAARRAGGESRAGAPAPVVDGDARGRSDLADAQLRAVAAMFVAHLVHCTQRLSLRLLLQPAAQGVDGRGDGGACAGGPRNKKEAHLMGRMRDGRDLSVLSYRSPAWNPRATGIPPILRSVLRGLTAFVRAVPRPLAVWLYEDDDSGDDTAGGGSLAEGGAAGRDPSRASGRPSCGVNERVKDEQEEEALRGCRRGGGDGDGDGESNGRDATPCGHRRLSDDGRAAEEASADPLLGRRDAARLVRRARLRSAGLRAVAAARQAAGGSPPGAQPRVVATAPPDGDGVRAAHATVEAALQRVARVYPCPFSQLANVHYGAMVRSARGAPVGAPPSADGGDGSGTFCRRGPPWELVPQLTGRVQLVLTDPPYNTRREAGQEAAEHDVLTEEDLVAAVEHFRLWLRPGGHVLIFCSLHQHPRWLAALRASVDSVGGSNGGRTRDLSAFQVDSTPQLVIKHPHAYHSVRRRSTQLANMADFVVHAFRAGVSAADAYRRVNYRCFGDVPTRFRAHQNIIDNVRPPLHHEAVLDPDGDGGTWIRREQKGVALLSELVQRYSQPGDLVVDPFAGTCATARACVAIALGQHRLVVAGDSDARVIRAAMPSLRRVFVEQVLQGGYGGTVATDEVVHAARLVHAAGAATPRAAPHTEWAAPAGMAVHSALPEALLRHLADAWAADADAARAGRTTQPGVPPPGHVRAAAVLAQAGVPVDGWPDELRAELLREDVEPLRRVDAISAGVFVARSQLDGGTAGLGVFAARPFEAGDVVAPLYGAIATVNLAAKVNKTAQYAAAQLGPFAPGASDFARRAVRVPLRGPLTTGAAPGRRHAAAAPGRRHAAAARTVDAVWLVPAPFCVGGLVNDPRSASPVDAAAQRAGAAAPEANAHLLFRDAGGLPDVGDLRDPAWVQLVACRTIAVGEEVLVVFDASGARGASAPPPCGVPPSVLRTASGSTPHTFAAPPSE